MELDRLNWDTSNIEDVCDAILEVLEFNGFDDATENYETYFSKRFEELLASNGITKGEFGYKGNKDKIDSIHKEANIYACKRAIEDCCETPEEFSRMASSWMRSRWAEDNPECVESLIYLLKPLNDKIKDEKDRAAKEELMSRGATDMYDFGKWTENTEIFEHILRECGK